MTTRLGTVAPDLVETVCRAPSTRMRNLAAEVSAWVVDGVGVVDPRLDAALVAVRTMRVGSSPERDALQGLVDELDERAWDVQDEVDAGRTPYDAYVAAFSHARAASSVWYALDSDARVSALEAIYEAQAAGDLADIRRLVADLLAEPQA